MVDIMGIYGDQLVKALKLTERMAEAITNGGAYGTAPNTTKALIARGLMSDVAGSYGNLTADGEHVRLHLAPQASSCATCDGSWQPIDPAAPVLRDWEVEQLARTMNYAGRTEDGVKIIHGMAVWTNEMMAGTVDLSDVGTDGWFHVAYDLGGDNGYRRVLMNAERIATTFDGCRAVDHLGRLYHVLGSDTECVGCFPQLAAPSEVYPDLTNELPGDAERAWDTENAAREGADIRAEEASEAAAELTEQVAESDMHDDLLAELFPGDDDPYGTYAECQAQLGAEILCCHECNASGVCDDHASVEAWVRAERAEAEHASEAAILAAYDAGVAAQSRSARVATVSPWKTSTSKHKRHTARRAR